MTFSNIFDRIRSKLIGLTFVGSSISPDLWIGIIIECFHGFGNTFVTIDVLIINVIYGIVTIRLFCKSKVMRCSGFGNGGRMHVTLIGEPFEEVNCFKYQGSQVSADGGCERDVVHRMNERYRAMRALKVC